MIILDHKDREDGIIKIFPPVKPIEHNRLLSNANSRYNTKLDWLWKIVKPVIFNIA